MLFEFMPMVRGRIGCRQGVRQGRAGGGGYRTLPAPSTIYTIVICRMGRGRGGHLINFTRRQQRDSCLKRYYRDAHDVAGCDVMRWGKKNLTREQSHGRADCLPRRVWFLLLAVQATSSCTRSYGILQGWWQTWETMAPKVASKPSTSLGCGYTVYSTDYAPRGSGFVLIDCLVEHVAGKKMRGLLLYFHFILSYFWLEWA